MNALGITVRTEIWSGGVISSFFFRDAFTNHSYHEKLNKDIIPVVESQTNLTNCF